MKLAAILDRMIDQVNEIDPADTYTILLGMVPLTDTHWAKGKKVYRWFPVSQTRLVPNYLVVLAPAPDNNRTGNPMFELHGRIDDGQITRQTITHNTLSLVLPPATP